MDEHTYFEGRPQAHRDRQLSAVAYWRVTCALLGGSSLFVFAVNLLVLILNRDAWSVATTTAAFTLFVFLASLLWRGYREITHDRGRIVPYFKKPTDGSLGDAWLSGKALSRNCETLDELAIRLRVRPLSSFGFFDDMRGEQVIWHDPKEGLQTIHALFGELDSVPELANECDDVKADLNKLQHVLTKADACGNLFAFLVNCEVEYINGMQIEQRKGSYF